RSLQVESGHRELLTLDVQHQTSQHRQRRTGCQTASCPGDRVGQRITLDSELHACTPALGWVVSTRLPCCSFWWCQSRIKGFRLSSSQLWTLGTTTCEPRQR